MPTQVFRYKSVQGRLAPIITVGLKLQEIWYPIATYVDSGAAYTLLHAAIAQGAGFNYHAGHRTSVQVGDGSFIPVYLHDLELQIGPERFLAKVETVAGILNSIWTEQVIIFILPVPTFSPRGAKYVRTG